MCGLIVFRTNEPIITEQCHTQRKFAIGLFNQTHLFVDRLETAASADFDKSTGMGVIIHKDRAKATITATSADGLATATYALKVGEKPLALNRSGTDGATVEGSPARA